MSLLMNITKIVYHFYSLRSVTGQILLLLEENSQINLVVWSEF